MSTATGTAGLPTDARGAWKVVASVTAVVGTIGGLLYFSTLQGAEYYNHVDEVVTNPAKWKGKKLRVQGFVVPGTIEQGKGDHSLDFRFVIESKPPLQRAAQISAEYHGLVPDTFKSGSPVVLTGVLGDDGKIKVAPDGVSAKCPSKYEEGAAVKMPGAAGATPFPPAAAAAPKN